MYTIGDSAESSDIGESIAYTPSFLSIIPVVNQPKILMDLNGMLTTWMIESSNRRSHAPSDLTSP